MEVLSLINANSFIITLLLALVASLFGFWRRSVNLQGRVSRLNERMNKLEDERIKKLEDGFEQFLKEYNIVLQGISSMKTDIQNIKNTLERIEGFLYMEKK